MLSLIKREETEAYAEGMLAVHGVEARPAGEPGGASGARSAFSLGSSWATNQQGGDRSGQRWPLIKATGITCRLL